MSGNLDSPNLLQTCHVHGLQFNPKYRDGCVLCARAEKDSRARYNLGVVFGAVGALSAAAALVAAFFLLDFGDTDFVGPEKVVALDHGKPLAAPKPSASSDAPRPPAFSDQATGFTVVDLVTTAEPPKTYVDRVRNTTVSIRSPYGRGLGFFVTWDCKVLTNRHLVAPDKLAFLQAVKTLDDLQKQARAAAKRGDDSLNQMAKRLAVELEQRRKSMADEKPDPRRIKVITIDAREYGVKGLKLSEARDMALLELDIRNVCPVAERGDKAALAVGTPLYTISNPKGFDLAVSAARYVAHRRTPPGGPWIVVDNDEEWNGSPLVTDQGMVVGMRTRAPEGVDDVGVALPIAALGWEFNVVFGSGSRTLEVEEVKRDVTGADLPPVDLAASAAGASATAPSRAPRWP